MASENYNANDSENCTNINDERRKAGDLTTHQAIQVIVALFYAAIFIVGITGNLCVVISVKRHRPLQTVRNIFIVGLSCSDLVVAFSSVIVTPIVGFMKVWYFGEILCHIIPLLQGSALFFSTLTLTCISIDRYILIIHPTKQSIKKV